MDRWKQEAMRSANNGLRNQIEHFLDAYEQQRPRLAEMFQRMEAVRVQANSPDQSVEVIVDAGGVLTDLRLTASALRKTPEQLAGYIVEAVQAAARSAREQHEHLTASVGSEVDAMPDLTDIAPEVPSIHDVRAFFRDDENQAR
ncbi:YbaB/EbfC family nucleoid-associated protein [Nocardia sp. NPDC051463]|uniref:YbaB/EbfC family nucleoid-associated protein n=1 Tax=Nocardia sp. NPDC051463 TaxID=3154845 RepID=UPI003450BC33